MRKYTEWISQYNRERNQYFEDAREENAKKNLRLLKKISLFLLFALPVIYGFTPFVVTGWQISVGYILLWPVMLLFAIYGIFYGRRPHIGVVAANVSCVIFTVVLVGFLIFFDVLMRPAIPASFMPLVLVVFPAVFIFRFDIMFPLLFLSEGVYVLLVCCIKEPKVGQMDIFTSLIALIFGCFVAAIVVQLRIQDNNAKREYQRRTMVDPVTGILNKFSFENSVRKSMKAREGNKQCALLLMDIDNLKRLNDEFGNQVGDTYLENVAEALTSLFRSSDVVGRVGGDEFMVYVRALESEEWLASRCWDLQEKVKNRSNEYGNVNLSCSIGVAISGQEKVTFADMYQIVDEALYEAKTRGRGRYVIHHTYQESLGAEDYSYL